MQGGAAARLAEAWKRTHRDTAAQCAREGMNFYPMAFEPSGACGPTADAVFLRLTALASADPVDRAALALRRRQRWCVMVRREAARAVLRRMPDLAPPAEEGPELDLRSAAAAARDDHAWAAG
eukprot:gene4843-biopygen34984